MVANVILVWLLFQVYYMLFGYTVSLTRGLSNGDCKQFSSIFVTKLARLLECFCSLMMVQMKQNASDRVRLLLSGPVR
jgi:hypothetical protein